MELWYKFLDLVLPFNWLSYGFMKNALLAVLLSAPAFALCGTMVVSNRMVFFSDVLGHSALTGIAIGVILGFVEPTLPMLVFAVILACAFNVLKRFTKAASDTVLGVLFAAVVALGVVILSRGGGFNKFTSYLIGDILAVSPQEIIGLFVMLAGIIAYWLYAGNALTLISINESLARSRGVAVFLVETSFSVLLALVVTYSIKLVGLLIINSLLVLPAAASRNFSNNSRQYTFWAVIFSLACSVAGLIASYYWNTASGATMVLFLTAIYAISALIGKIRHKRI